MANLSLQQKLKNRQIILASGSPRRQALLTDLGLSYRIELKPVEEIFPDHLAPKEAAEYLAKLKANAFDHLKDSEILITGDTVVAIDQFILGKPKNKEEAIKMLKLLSGRKHQVISSVFLKSNQKLCCFSATTQVNFKTLTSDEIEYYVSTYKPFDKAGAYGIQEWIGQIGITGIEGSYYTVLGLPIHLLYKNLLQF